MSTGGDIQTDAKTDAKTISDFGEQWTQHRDNSGFYGSTDLFVDAFGKFVSLDEIRGKRVADIGSGSGRIVNMLLAAGAREVVAVEPSAAMEVLKENTAKDKDRITYVHATGEAIADYSDLDLIVSYGVLHHITDPSPVVRAAKKALKPGAKFLAWLYGREGNAAYLALAEPMRLVTKRMPDALLRGVAHAMNLGLDVYVPACAKLPKMPLAGYMNNVVAKLDREKRYLVVYDQLNPAYAKYYREREARALFEDAGFARVDLHHRHGYSWTVSGTK